MNLLIDINEINKYKSRELLPLECKYCKSVFTQTKNHIQWALKRTKKTGYEYLLYCSKSCKSKSEIDRINLNCKNCTTSILVTKTTINKSKSGNVFCSKHCSAVYNNNHKTTGCRRSKLEKWIEVQLKLVYPHLEIDYNKSNAIEAELDIFIPSLKLAFELNGIFHYEAIYGENKLNKTQSNDKRKFQACLEQQIELCIIDTSSQKYFKENTSKKYLSIITQIIDKKLLDIQSSNN
jgi:hypothetical protein